MGPAARSHMQTHTSRPDNAWDSPRFGEQAVREFSPNAGYEWGGVPVNSADFRVGRLPPLIQIERFASAAFASWAGPQSLDAFLHRNLALGPQPDGGLYRRRPGPQ